MRSLQQEQCPPNQVDNPRLEQIPCLVATGEQQCAWVNAAVRGTGTAMQSWWYSMSRESHATCVVPLSERSKTRPLGVYGKTGAQGAFCCWCHSFLVWVLVM
jgi:hypothetical protein